MVLARFLGVVGRVRVVAVGHVRVIPQALEESYEHLYTVLQKLSAGG